MCKKLCFIVAALAAVLLNCTASAEEENLSVSCKLSFWGIDRTLPLQSNEPLPVWLDIQGLRTKNTIALFDLNITLEQDGTVIGGYSEQQIAILDSGSSTGTVNQQVFPPQKPGKYVLKVTIKSNYNKGTASCQIPVEIVEDRDIRLIDLCFIQGSGLPKYPIFMEGTPIIISYRLPEIQSNNSLTMGVFIDDDSKPIISGTAYSDKQLQSYANAFAVNGTGKHKITIKVHDAQGKSVQYVMPLFIVPKSTFEDAAPTAPAE